MTNANTTSYSEFAPDQLLTHEQLNSLVGYTDEQLRRSRVKLLGVGVLDGLRPRLVGSDVSVSAGAGVTTDGDLLHFDGGDHTHYRVLRSKYEPFKDLTIYELLGNGVDQSTPPLASLLPGLRTMVVLAYMERYVEASDLCGGAGCDNLGRHVRNEQRLLLLSSGDASKLAATITTLHDVYDDLPLLSVGRPQLGAWTSTKQLADAYRAVCSTAYKRLSDAFQKLDNKNVLGPIQDHAKRKTWILAKLDGFESYWASHDVGIQYYYGLLKDLVDTWNGFRETLFGDRGWRHTTAATQFPKHLLLGSLDAVADAEVHRTPWFPASSSDSREHACMLLRKLGALLEHFSTLFQMSKVSVTPSAFEDRCLEERAVPIYYPYESIIDDWSHAHLQRGSTRRILSAHAALWGEDPSVKDPLGSQLGAFPFFRVEGHIGRPVAWALTQIRQQIENRNLPFSVQAVQLGSNIGLDEPHDEHIEDRSAPRTNRPSFGNYLSEHPGLEHFAGVTRGGTFVLVCDADQSVVADFMLPGDDKLHPDLQLGQRLRMLTPAGGDGQIGVPGETLEIALRVRISDGAQPIPEALVEFEVLGTMLDGEALDQWTGGCVHASFNTVKTVMWPGGNRAMRAIVKTDSDGIAQVQRVLGTHPGLCVQRVRATLLDESRNRTSEQMLFTAHLSLATEVRWFANSIFSFLAPAPGNSVQSALDGIGSALARLGLDQSSIVPRVVDTDGGRHSLRPGFWLRLPRLARIELRNLYHGDNREFDELALRLAISVWVGEENGQDLRLAGRVAIVDDYQNNTRTLTWTYLPQRKAEPNEEAEPTDDPTLHERRVIIELMPSALGLPGSPLRWGFWVKD